MTIKDAIVFSAGALAGGLAVYIWHRHKAKKQAEEIIPAEDVLQTDGGQEERKYHELIKPYTKPEEDDVYSPEVIDSSEFGSLTSYAVHFLTWYSDNALADENDMLIDGAEELVGTDFMNHFDNDVVCIRNDEIQADFEITRDPRSYIDVVGERPELVEDYDDDEG